VFLKSATLDTFH